MASGLFNLKQVNQAISQGAWSGYIAPKWVEYLVVAGGGGAGSRAGGGGGAGGLLTGIVTVAAGTSYTVTVGTGGAGGVDSTSAPTSGNNSVLGSIASTGGGYGSSGRSPGNSGGASGGSGGGGSYSSGATSAGQGASGQGNAGSVGFASTSGNYLIGGGGGGAGTVGINAINNSTSSVAGSGGSGIASAISGSTIVYAGGGGGGSELTYVGSGGVGGGGGGGYASNGGSGAANTGGGGGGGGYSTYSGGAGGSGIVVVRYPGNVQFFTGGTVNYNNGYIIHIFTSSGTLAPTTPTVYNTSYQISRSLRFNSADSAYLNRTPASASNRTTWTWSGWVKRSANGSDMQLFSAGGSGAFQFLFTSSSDTLQIYDTVSSTTNVITSQVFRDFSSWYHVVLAMDTTQATASNRFKLYINGTQVTAFGTATYPAQNSTLSVNNTVNHSVGSWSGAGGGNFFSGYMTEVTFIDGQALTPSSFGATSTTTGVWAPIQYTGSYGTNGFYLNFSDNSNTTAATLGKDYSGNGNNWTPNNFSVTAGAGNDSLVDSPTSYGTDTGVGGTVRGNYATFNPLVKVSFNPTLSNGNLDLSAISQWSDTIGTIGVNSGKWYWEVVSGNTDAFVGICGSNADLASSNPQNASGTIIYYGGNGEKRIDGTSSSYGASYTTETIGVALDIDGGTVTFYKSNTSQGSISLSSSTLNGKTIFPFFVKYASTMTVNFGQRPFAYTAPSGFKALCTQNLPTPTIGATTATQASNYFGIVLRNGTGTSGGTFSTTVNMANGAWLWEKPRSTANMHQLVDSVRGISKISSTNSAGAEVTDPNDFTAFGTNSFSVGSTDWSSSITIVDWIWAANGSGSTNTSGSITSTVSANTTSGFSIVTYSGQSAAGTIGHGLGVAPSWIIVKNRSSASPGAWTVYSSVLGNTSLMFMNTSDAVYTGNTAWNSTSPTSSVFSVGPSSLSVNTVGNNFVAYCFAEVAGYSKFGSYNGNSSSDGPFIFTGFRPAYVMIKCSNTAGYNWIVFDNKRSGFNVNNDQLYPNLSAAEDAGGSSAQFIDLLSNGFKLRNTAADKNAVGGSYIFAAFAEAPLKFSLAR
jgi:hypothetical protein